MPYPRASLASSVLLLLLACTDRPLDTSATGSTTAGTDASASTTLTTATATDPAPTTTSESTAGSSSATTVDPATSTTSTGDPSGTTDVSGTSDPSGTTGVPPDGECDLLLQNCPAGQKCMPVSLDDEYGNEAARCRPLVDDPDGLGELCEVLGASGDGLDTCDEGQFCWRDDLADEPGTCLALCSGAPDDPACPQPEFACRPSGGVANFCVRPCDPLAQDCPDAGVCAAIGADGFLCLADASGAGGGLFEQCGGVIFCDPGLHCTSAYMIPECPGGRDVDCCVPWCDVDAEPDPCPGTGLACSAWTLEEPIPGLEDVGVCGFQPI